MFLDHSTVFFDRSGAIDQGGRVILAVPISPCPPVERLGYLQDRDPQSGQRREVQECDEATSRTRRGVQSRPLKHSKRSRIFRLSSMLRC